MKMLFGVLTDDDISAVKENIRLLALSQDNMKHVVNESLIILNKVQGEVIANRKTLNEAIDALKLYPRVLQIHLHTDLDR
jgi:hypothetical protein